MNELGDKNLRSIASWIFVSILAATSANAGVGKVERGPAPAWAVRSNLMDVPAEANGLAFFRSQDVIVHLDSHGVLHNNNYRIRLLHPNALELGNIALSWNPASDSPIVHAIKVYRGAEVIDVLKTTSFEILRREDQLEAARLDGVLTAVLRVPDLRVGDELDVSYTIRSYDPTIGAEETGILTLSSQPLPGRYRLELNWEPGREPKIWTTPDMSSVATRRDRAVAFRFDNPPLMNPPKGAPPRLQLQRVVEFSGFEKWQDVSSKFAPLFANAAQLAPKSVLKAEARRIAAAHTSPMDRAAAALKLVQQNVRYIYVGLDRGNLLPATADDTWQRRYGDCKGKTALLLALLAELGITAEPVLVNNNGTDDGLDQRLPNHRAFDHVLVRAQIDGKIFWLDGTLPPVALPSAEPAIPYRWVLPATMPGSGLEQLAWHPSPKPDIVELVNIDARSGFEQPATVTTTSIVRGVKGLEQYIQLSAVRPEQLLAAVRQELTGSTWQSVDAASWHYDEQAGASIISITGTWIVAWDNDGDGARSYALPGGGFSPPERLSRPLGQDQKTPFYNASEYNCHVTTLRVPSSTQLENWSSKSGFNTHIYGRNYYRAFERREGAIRMVRGFRVNQMEIDPASAQQDNARLADFDNSMGWVFYDPRSRSPLLSTGVPVPTTTEIDWTANLVPCLSSETIGSEKPQR